MIRLLIPTYSIALIAAGHGIGPIGLLLIMGRADEWVLGQVAGWASIIWVVVVSVACRRDAVWCAWGQLFSSFGMYLSWFAFASAASKGQAFWGNLHLHFILSIPFQAAFLASVAYYCWKIRASKAEGRRAL